MTDLTFNDPCLLFAVRRESQAFRREFLPNERFPGAPCPAWFCAPRALPELSVLVLETGVGMGSARTALEWVLSKPMLEGVPYQPKLILSTGFAGGLQQSLKVGDLIVATEVIDTEGTRWPTTWPGELPPGDWQPPLHRGRLLSVSQLVGSPDEKRALGKRHDALAVEMEAAALAPLCLKHGIPFGCVRAMSDGVATELSPKLVSVLAGGKVSPLRLLLAVLAAPRLLGELRRLARDTRRASEQLGKALGELLTLTLA